MGFTSEDAQKLVLGNLARAQDACVSQSCPMYPALRCSMVKNRWVRTSYNGEDYFEPRYRIPHCDRWDFKEGDTLTVISFHQLQSHLAVTSRELYWMHTAFYGFAVPTEDIFGDDLSVSSPHVIDFNVAPTFMKQLGGHAAWWDKAHRSGGLSTGR